MNAAKQEDMSCGHFIDQHASFFCSMRAHLEELGYPTIPQLHISAERFSDLPEEEHLPALQQWLEQWSTEHSIHEAATAVVVKPAVGSSAAGLHLVDDFEGAMHAIAELLDGVSLFHTNEF